MKRLNSIANPSHPRGLRQPYLAAFLGRTSARRIQPTSSKKIAKALVFPKYSMYLWASSISNPWWTIYPSETLMSKAKAGSPTSKTCRFEFW